MREMILLLTAQVELVLLVLLLLSAPSSTWRDYHALMNLKRMRDAGVPFSPLARVMAGYLLARGYLLDFIVNVVHLTALMRESRVTRLKFHGNERQRRIADWFCGQQGLNLDGGDPSGCHCKP